MWVLAVMYLFLIPCAALFMYTKHMGVARLAVLFKAMSTGIILLAGIIGALRSPGEMRLFAWLVAAGLAMGLAGDVAICYVFVVGMLFFGIGHVLYILAILRVTMHALWAVPVFIALGLLIFFLYKKSKMNFGTLLVPAAIYCLMIMVMVSLAATVPFSVFPGGVVLLVGAVLFAASDAMLALNKFHDRFSRGLVTVDRFNSRPGVEDGFNQKLDIVSLCCYYMGQSLFAVSIYLLQ